MTEVALWLFGLARSFPKVAAALLLPCNARTQSNVDVVVIENRKEL
jgi:hypothetical protein